MLNWLGSRYFWGGMFILIGGIFLLQYLGFIVFGVHGDKILKAFNMGVEE